MWRYPVDTFFSGNSQMWSNHHGHVLLEGVHPGTSLLGSNWAASCKVEDAQGSHTLGDTYETANCNIICKCQRFKWASISISRRAGKQTLLCSFTGVEYRRWKKWTSTIYIKMDESQGHMGKTSCRNICKVRYKPSLKMCKTHQHLAYG